MTSGRRVLVAALALALFLAGLALFRQDAGFPGYYHVNEPDKALQILERTRNFLHPLLLLTATDGMALVAGPPAGLQQAVERGRLVSALGAACALVALALAAWRIRGGLAAGATALFVGTSYLLYLAAHYMKEDGVLAMGAGLVLLSLVALARRPTLARAALAGLACGVAVSAKYAAAALLPFALGVLVLALRRAGGGAPARRAAAAIVALLAAALLAYAAINYQVLLHPAEFQRGLAQEWRHGVGGRIANLEVEPRTSVPHLDYMFELRRVPAAIQLLALFALVQLAVLRRAAPRGSGVVAAFCGWYFLVLSLSPLHAQAYFLPVDLGLRLLAGLGLAGLVQLAPLAARPRLARVAAALVLVVAAADSARLLWPRIEGFRHDYRAELMQWMKTNLPPDAVVAQDGKARIPTEGDWRFAGAPPHRPQKVLYRASLSEWGSVAAMREAGITHAIIAGTSERRFQRAVGAAVRHRDFYRELREACRVLWTAPRHRGWDTILNTDLWLCELEPGGAPAGTPVPTPRS
ncbi:MAG: hypothetical protein KBD01_10855 [Acidobacteria bacterium]|nr:hypothetical protein [Acidobacteriota bacterium]